MPVTAQSEAFAIHSILWTPVYNNSGETIPALAPMEISSLDANGLIYVVKPTADSLPAERVLFNGPSSLASGAVGKSSGDYPLLSQMTGTPAAKTNVGTVSGQWYLSDAQTGFLTWSGTEDGIALVAPCRPRTDPCGNHSLLVTLENPDCAWFDGMEFDIYPVAGGCGVTCCYERTLHFPAIFGGGEATPGCSCGGFNCYLFRYYFKTAVGHRATFRRLSICAGTGLEDQCGGLSDVLTELYFPGPAGTDYDNSNLDWSNPILLSATAIFHGDYCCMTAPVGGIDNNLTATVSIP